MMGSGMLNGLPVWVKGIAVVGFPALVATYLLLAVTGTIPSALSAEHESIRETLRGGQQEVQQEQKRVREALENNQKEQAQILRLICSSVAKSEAVALECLRAR